VIFELLRQEWGGHDPNLARSGRDSGLGKKRHTKVFASSFDGFVDEVLKVMPSLNLPVVTGVQAQQAPAAAHGANSSTWCQQQYAHVQQASCEVSYSCTVVTFTTAGWVVVCMPACVYDALEAAQICIGSNHICTK
jgi:hypothetical protein